MPLIIDPDDLNQGIEIIYDTSIPTAPTIELLIAGNLSVDGVRLKTVYSASKEFWGTDANLIKFPFPFVPITDEFFELQEGWNWKNQATRDLLRRGGFLVRNTSGNVTEHWAGVAIQDAEPDDQIYYDIGSGATAFTYQGSTAEVVQVISDPDGNGDYADGFNLSNNLTAYNREQGQLYSSASTQGNGEASLLAPKLFSLTTGTGNDLKINESDANISTIAPYTGMSITYIEHQNRGNWTAATVYAANDVVQSTTDGRWYITATGGTATGTDADLVGGSDTGVTWASYSGEREIGANWYAFGVLIDGNLGTAEQIYEFVQYSLRQATDIDAGVGTVLGQTADSLLVFIGDTLRTLQQSNGSGVFIDNFQAADTNRLEFRDDLFTTTSITFPFVAVVTLQINNNLVNDGAAIYRVFFTDANGNNFGDTDAIIVEDNSAAIVSGNITGQSSIQFDFDYDGNTQGGRTPATDADITVVAIGLDTGQYVRAEGTITRSTSNTISLVAPVERNYENPA